MRRSPTLISSGLLGLALLAGACAGTQPAVTDGQPGTPVAAVAARADSWPVGTVYGENELWITSDHPFTIDPSLLDRVESGMTLRELVALLGKGWMSPHEGCGIITWRFHDGRELTVWPRTYELDEATTGGELGTLRLRARDGSALPLPAPTPR